MPGGCKHQSLLDAARIELGLRHFLEENGSRAFTDTFEDLHGLKQLPGIAVQRLMADGYGFGAEGDWKTAALVRAVKVMSQGLKGGASFMEDYTYHLKNGGQVLGAHMLEVCPSITEDKPSVEIHPLSIGGKEDPVRLVFTAASGKAVNASVVDMGNRFRLIVNQVNLIEPEQPLPKLPVARAVWIPEPNLKIAATAWIQAGGAHHTALSRSLTTEHLENFAEMAGMECLVIDRNTAAVRLPERAPVERCVLSAGEWVLDTSCWKRHELHRLALSHECAVVAPVACNALSISVTSPELRRNSRAPTTPETCLGLRTPTIAPVTDGLFSVQAIATSPGVRPCRAPISRSNSTSCRFRESNGSWKLGRLRRQSSPVKFATRSRVMAPVSKPADMGEYTMTPILFAFANGRISVFNLPSHNRVGRLQGGDGSDGLGPSHLRHTEV